MSRRTPISRYYDRVKRSPVLVADGDGRAERLIRGALDGSEPFAGLLVGTQDVKAFLDKTDGEKLVNDAGLDDDLVPTAKMVAGAAGQTTFTYTDGNVDISAGLGWVTVATLVVTTIAGETVRLDGQFNFSVDDALTATMLIQAAWFKGGTQMATQSNAGSVRIAGGNHVLPAGKNGSKVTDTPGAGTFTYTLQAQASGSEYVGIANRRYADVITLRKP
ncbi:hypothetical protein IWC96_14470 [Brevundimonas sp. BAL450]|uniref:hypothetical protein n=1 Tax=Brevundimonas sp. BAL450 TaxID=1708162 RepID=UPI0018CB03E8|nr:hypothetical protein [Brevundimonas sp. BAL450]MBG7616479.1 hypothetical protein [Brevundimonas sp. BAL450]